MCKGDRHMKKELTFEEKYEKVVARIEANSPYKRMFWEVSIRIIIW